MLTKNIKSKLGYFTKGELILWGASVLAIVISFFAFELTDYLTLVASLIGVTSLIFNAKGNPFGQVLIIIFGVLYSIVSLSYAYYGELVTYIGMTAPMALISLISWIRNPYNGKKSEVKVNHLRGKELFLMFALTAAVIVAFYFILKAFNTANLIVSTLSVATSFAAAYLTFRRSAYFALAYASNDIILIALWGAATINNITYLSVVICFVIFLINDIYGFVNWLRMRKRQSNGACEPIES